MLHTVLHWLPLVLGVLFSIAVGWFSFKLGKRWRRGYSDALALRSRLESEAAAASSLRAQLSQRVEASGNVVHIDTRSGVLSELREPGRGSLSEFDGGTACALCGGPHRWSDCGAQINGPALYALLQRVGVGRVSAPSEFGPLPVGGWSGARAASQCDALDSEEDVGG